MHLIDLLGNAAPAASDLRRRLEALPAFAPAAHCLLSGPERSGKTSLLFQAAHSAARQGKRVLLLCRRGKLEQTPPLMPDGMTISDPAWQHVHIKYLDSGLELLRYVSLIHALPGGPPDLLLVDDLHTLAELPAADRPRPRDMALCRILASLHEAACAASQLKGSPCQLIVTEASHTEGPRLLYIMQRWLPLALHIRPAGQANALALLNPQPDVPPACFVRLMFSLKHGTLALEDLQPAVHW